MTVKEVETRVFHTVFEMDREQELAKYEVVVVGSLRGGGRTAQAQPVVFSTRIKISDDSLDSVSTQIDIRAVNT